MTFRIFFVVLSAILCFTKSEFLVSSKEQGTKWAVLLAGSSQWYNYRHQSDICHLYQILHNNGVPDKNIVVMMYDDIAYNSKNKFKGSIFNRPNGTNVYKGILKDYTREDVTPENFLAVLQGNKSVVENKGSGKIVDSGPNDSIFVNMVDHGAPGLFGFPEGFLFARDFISAIISMHHNNRFKEMVIYMESCESGSMFYKLLPENLNVYAMTASNPYQSSYACYYDKAVGTYLGDYFSVKWMEDTDVENLSQETLDEQFHIVYNETSSDETTSRYGDLRMESEVLSNFLGARNYSVQKNTNEQLYYDFLKRKTAVPSHDVPIHIIQEKMNQAESKEEISSHKTELFQLLKKRNFLEGKIKQIVMFVTWNWNLSMQLMAEVTDIYDWVCYEETVKYFHVKCFNLGRNTYALQFLKVFSKLCNRGYSAQEIIQTMSEVCNHPPMSDII